MIHLNIQINGQKELDLAFRRVSDSITDLRDTVWPAMEDVFYELERGQFETSGRANKWAELSPRYEEYRSKRYGQPFPFPLQRTGALRASLTRKGADHNVNRSEPRTLTLGTDLPYAVYHQRGNARLPQRKPIDIQAGDGEKFQKAGAKALRQVVARTGFGSAGFVQTSFGEV